jgi:L-alanine-DL-glutamate epimerase-like enolase superfamily enzyme
LPADDPATLERSIGRLSEAKAIKLKLDGNLDIDRERMAVVRRARPDAWLATNANQISSPPTWTGLPVRFATSRLS